MSATKRRLQLQARKRTEEKRRIEQMKRDFKLTEAPDPDAVVLDAEPPRRWGKFLLGLLLAPVCLLALLILFDLLFHATVKNSFLKSEGFWFFGSGCVSWYLLGWLHSRPTLLYVFAHEMTHAITARLSGARVHRVHVDEEGGFVETDKTGVFITLSPYMVPFYTVVVFALYALISLFVNMEHEMQWPIPGLEWTLRMKWVWIFYFFVGLTWCFHLTFTMDVLRTEQTDLLHNGEFFSIMVIFLANLAVIGVLFVSASPTVGWADVWKAVTDAVS